MNPTAGNITHQNVNLIMGGVAFYGPIGFGASTVYFVVDATVGWDTVFNGLAESGAADTMIGW
jgi:hypothetical protein